MRPEVYSLTLELVEIKLSFRKLMTSLYRVLWIPFVAVLKFFLKGVRIFLIEPDLYKRVDSDSVPRALGPEERLNYQILVITEMGRL